MKKFLCLICFLIAASFAVCTSAMGTYTTIENGVTLYSEYYPNTKASFKGTIVFENGSGTNMEEWTQNKTFFNCAKEAGTLFLYDRNGLGKSPPDIHLSTSNPITGKFINDKLLKLLKQRHINPPYIIVAHSYGGLYAGYFTLKYPDLVKGLLLIDPVPRKFNFSTKLVNDHETAIIAAKTQPSSTVYKKFSGSDVEVAYQLLGFETAKKEIKKMGAISNNIPVIIISSTGMEKDKPLKEDWYSSQKQWLNDNPQSKILTVTAGHFIQLEKPKNVCEQLKSLTNNK